ncbi:MAG: hypothetical protein V8Q17_08780 [Acutalibacteraceae bacterium]
MVDSEVTSDITVSSELTESSSVVLDSDLTLYSGYWYNSEDTESYEFKFTAIDAAHGEFSLGVFRLGTLYGNCELTSNNVAAFSSNSGMSGTLTFNTYRIEVIINNPNQYWPSYILLDQSNGNSPLVINAPEIDYNDPAYVPENAYEPNGEKYAADAADIPQPTVVCPQCGTKFFDTASFVDGVCYPCYQLIINLFTAQHVGIT